MTTLRRHSIGTTILGFVLLLGSVSTVSAQTGQITGTVYDQSGTTPVGDLSVELYRDDGGHVTSTTTDSVTGVYSFSTLDDGFYLVRALFDPGRDLVGEYYLDANEYDFDLATRLEISGGTTLTGIDFDLSPASSISGFVSGLGAGEEADLSVYESESGRYRGGAQSSAGSYTVGSLPAANYKLFAEPFGTNLAFQWWDSNVGFGDADTILVGDDVDVTGVNFTLTAATSISGTVSLYPDPGDGGVTLEQIWIDAYEATTHEHLRSANVNSSGAYEFANLPAGSYRLQAQAWGTDYITEVWLTGADSPGQDPVFDLNLAEPIVVDPANPATGIDFLLTEGRRISGNVVLDGFGPLENVSVHADRLGEGFYGGTGTDALGNYTISSLAPGEYQVRVESSSVDEPFTIQMWQNKNPNEPPDPVDVSASDAIGIDFLVLRQRAISGKVFLDFNGDQIQDVGEPGYSNFTIRPYEYTTGDFWGHAAVAPDGRYSVGVPPGVYQVEATPNDWNLLQESWLDAYFGGLATPVDVSFADATNIDFGLVSADHFGTLRGRVVAEGTTDGIPGVDVQVLLFDGDHHIVSVQSDVDGYFVVTNLPPGSYKIYFESWSTNVANDTDFVSSFWASTGLPGVIDPNLMRIDFPTVPDPVSGPGTDLGDFGLSLGGSISGVVYPPTGETLPEDVQVSAQSFESGGHHLPSVTADPSGAYQLRGLPAQATYRVQADAWGTGLVSVYYWNPTESTFDYGTATAVEVLVGAERLGIDLFMIRGGSISGTVTAASTGLPVPDFQVSAGLLNDPLGRGFGGGASTAADGTYTITDLVPGDYNVWTDARSGSFANQTHPDIHPVAEGADTPGVDFNLVAGGRVTGRITQLIGGVTEPVVNIRIEAVEYDNGQFWSDGYTDADGYYSIEALAQGYDYRVQVQPWASPDPQFFNFISEFYPETIFWDDAGRVQLPVDSGGGVSETSGIDIQIDLGGAISGIVTAGTEPLQNVWVSADLYDGRPYGNGDHTDHNGFYIIRGLPDDSYRVHASPWPEPYVDEYFDDTRDWSLATVVSVLPVVEGQPLPITGAINFDLSPAHAISGRVTDAAGINGVPNIQVIATGHDGFSGGQAWTDGSGYYVIHSLAPGTYDVEVNTWNTSFIYQVQQADLTSGDATDIDFALATGATISGHVTDASSGLGIPNLQVTASGLDVPHWSNAWTDENGDYFIGGLLAGTYEVAAESSDTEYIRQHVQVTLALGDASVQDFALQTGAAISGRVYVDENANDGYDAGEEREGVWISASDFYTGQYFANGMSNAEGLYEVRGLGVGSYMLSLDQGEHNLVPMVYPNDTGEGGALPVDVVDGGSGPEDVTGIDFLAIQGHEINGTVFFDSNGDGIQQLPGEEGIPNISVYNEFQGNFWINGAWTGSQPDGTYTLHGVYPGSHTVIAHAGGTPYASELYKLVGGVPVGTYNYSEADHVDVSGGDAAGIDLSLQLGGGIAGTVRDASTGDPLGSIDLWVNRFDGDGLWWGTTTDPNGEYLVDGLSPGDYIIQAYDNQEIYVSEIYNNTPFWEDASPVNVVARSTVNDALATQINFDLDQAGVIKGVVYDDANGNGIQDAGEPGIEGLSVNVEEFADPNRYFHGGSTDASGIFSIGALPSSFALRVHVDPWPTDFLWGYYDGGDDRTTTDGTLAAEVWVSPGDTTPGINFGLSRGGTITGHVFDGDGNPIEGLYVNARSDLWSAGNPTDSDGLYTLAGLLPGSYAVWTSGYDGYPSEYFDNKPDQSAHTPVNVSAGTTVGGIDFVLPTVPLITGGPMPAAGERGSTVTGVMVTAEQLTANATVDLGTGLTINNLTIVGDTITFDVTIAADAPLGGRSLSVVNDQLLEDGVTTLMNAFQVVPGTGDVPAPSATRLYATDGGRSQLRVYGTADNSLLGTIDLCCNPLGISLSPDGNFAYVNGGVGKTSVIDTRLGDVGKEVARFHLYGNAGTEAMAVTAAHMYAADRSSDLNQVWVIDTSSWTIDSTIALSEPPSGLGIDPAEQTMYVLHTYSDSVSLIDLDPVSPTFHQPLTTISLPGGAYPYAVDFTADGSRAYIGGYWDTYVIDTALAVSDPTNAVVAHLPELAAPFNIAQHTASGKELAFFESYGRVAVVDITPAATDPETLRYIEAGNRLSGFRATEDQLFLAYSGSLDLWVVDIEELFTSTTLSTTRFDGPEFPAGTGLPAGGLAVGATPGGPPVAAPSITVVSGPVETGADFTLTINGSDFAPGAIAWLQGTPDRGTVTSATPTELIVDFPATIPGGDFPVVVTNPVAGGGASTVSTALAEIQLPSSYTSRQTLYVTSYGEGAVHVFNPDGSTATTQTLPRSTTIVVTPDGSLGFVGHNFYGPWLSGEPLPEHYFDMSVLDLDSGSPDFLDTLGYIPWMRSSYESPAVTPNLDNPNGVFIYVPDYVTSDTVAVVDPATLAEVDTIALDGNVSDRNLRPIDVALTPDGTLLYTANIRGNSVSIVDAVTRQVIGELTNGGDLVQPQDLVITPTDTGAGVFVYVTAQNTVGDLFLFIFEAGNTNDATALVGQIPLPLNPRSLAISQGGETVYAAANLAYPDLRSEVYVIDVGPSERVIAHTIDLPDRVYKLIEAPDDQLLYLTGMWSSSVFVVDLAPGAGYPLITTLNTPSCPMDVAVGPSSGILSPVVVSVIPSSGCPVGGDPVVITGINFADDATVEFGAISAPSVNVVGSYAIEANTPGNGAGTVDVTVRNVLDGTSHTLTNAFTYELDPILPVITTPPYVSSQKLVGPSGSETATVEIRWQTDAASDSLVDYREIGQPSFLQESDAALTADHLVTLTGLTPATNYEFRATFTKNCGNPVSSPAAPGTVAFTTPTVPDTTPPEFSAGNPTVDVTPTEALIQWETNEVATSVVRYDAQLGDGHQDRVATGPDGTMHSVLLTGLQAHTEYEFVVESVDASGNVLTSPEVLTFTTGSLPDQTPPEITAGPEPTYLANDLVIIQWQTNELSTSFVNYGTSSILEQGVVDMDMVHNHVVFLTNLQPGTVYYYQVGSTDPSGNTVLSIDPLAKTLRTVGTSRLTGDLKAGVVTLKAGAYLTKAEATSGFTTPELADTAAPQVLSVSVTPLSFDRVLVTVETDEDASLRAHFGAGGLTDSAFNPAFSQRTSLLLAGLDGDTTYQLSVELTDPKGNTTTEVQPTFTTPAEPDTTEPAISALSINPITDTTALLAWTTDEPADTTVYFGAQGGPLDRQVGRLGLSTAHEILLTGLAPATTYDAEVASHDASQNSSTVPTAFTTTAATPVITSVTPSSAVQGSTVEVAVNGIHLDNAQVDLGTGVTVNVVTVNDSGTQARVGITVDPNATVGPRQLTVTTDFGTATTQFSIADETVPAVEILSPLDGDELTTLTIAVHGTVSELADVTVNGEAATVTNGTPITFDATVTLAGSGLRGISATAIDPSGNRGTDTISVMVTNQPPVALCADVSASADESCQAVVTPEIVDGGSYDPDGTPLSMSVDPGLLSSLGPHTVVLTVDDGEIQDSCDATVTVVDETAPTIESIAATPSVLWPPNHKMKEVTVDVLSSDACDSEPICAITGVTSNEVESGCDKKDEHPDWEITGDLSVNLRAERCGSGDDRIYTIAVTCADATENTTEATTVVTVPHDQGG